MKLMKKFKVVIMGLVLTVSIGALTGCSTKDTSSEDNKQSTEVAAENKATYKDIDGKEAEALVKDSEEVLLIDVRGEADYLAGHIENAINLPVEDIKENLEGTDVYKAKLESFKDKPVIFYCNSGGKSSEAAKILIEKGYTKVYNAQGVKEYDYKIVQTVPYQNITGKAAEALIANNKDMIIVDVRSEEEFDVGHIENSVNLYFEDLAKDQSKLKDYKNKVVLLYCNTGNKSEKTAKVLQDNGFTKVYNAEDGVKEYDYKLVK